MRTKTTIVLSLSLAVGCASTETTTPSSTTRSPAAPHSDSTGAGLGPEGNDADEALAAVDDNLARLASLEVFEVGELVVAEPESAHNCYGPCEGYEDDLAAARAEAATRLARFTDRAIEAAEAPAGDADPHRDLAALRALEVVEVGALIETEPRENPKCYNLPCPSDLEEARADNEMRARRLAAIVAATEDL